MQFNVVQMWTTIQNSRPHHILLHAWTYEQTNKIIHFVIFPCDIVDRMAVAPTTFTIQFNRWIRAENDYQRWIL